MNDPAFDFLARQARIATDHARAKTDAAEVSHARALSAFFEHAVRDALVNHPMLEGFPPVDEAWIAAVVNAATSAALARMGR